MKKHEEPRTRKPTSGEQQFVQNNSLTTLFHKVLDQTTVPKPFIVLDSVQVRYQNPASSPPSKLLMRSFDESHSSSPSSPCCMGSEGSFSRIRWLRFRNKYSGPQIWILHSKTSDFMAPGKSQISDLEIRDLRGPAKRPEKVQET